MAIFGFLKRRAVLIVIGFILLGVFIWYAGALFAFGNYHPLASRTAQFVFMGACVGLWLAVLLWKRLRAGRASDGLLKAVVKQSDAARASPDATALRERFEEATQLLKKGRRSGHTLYELPWYVIIGAPGSGKTTVLVNSGLHMPLAQRFGKDGIRGVGGTRNCDWLFTDDAVFLDTAGRYTTQDSDATADSAGWGEFLKLLKKYRARRPVNGVLLAVSAFDLMTQHPAERESFVAAARHRLEELNRELGIQLPVYLLVTKCDLIAGFSEYFDDLAQDGRAQVWGVTFPYPDTLSGAALTALPAEFDELISRVNARVYERVEADRDQRRRARIFAFPQQIAALRDLLAGTVREIFGSTRFDGKVLLRGVYFTSGTQEGTPIDRLLGAMGRTFNLGSDAVAAVPAGHGKAYFIQILLKDVVLGEAGLAGLNRNLEIKKAAAQLAAYAGLALLVAFGVIALSVSYGRNKTYLAQVATEAARLETVPPVTGNAALEAALPRLDAVAHVVDVAEQHHGHVPWLMRFGLYQGRAIGNAARDAYLRELDGALLPRILERVRQRLTESTAAPDRLYQYLKAYLMLGQPDHMDPAQLEYLGDVEWKRAYPNDPDTRQSLGRHFHALLARDDRIPAQTLDEQLVARARSAIRQASVPRLMYTQLRINYAGNAADALRLDLAAGMGAEQVFRRKSGASLADPMPALYTKKAFNDVATAGTKALVQQFSDDSWVMGTDKLSINDSAKLTNDVIDLYEKDYIDQWDKLLADIQLAPFPPRQTSDALKILAAPTSPLRGLLQTVDANTHLLPGPGEAPTGKVAQAEQAFQDKMRKLINEGRDLAGITNGPIPGTQVTAHFAALHHAVVGAPGAAPGSAPLDAVLNKIGQIQQQLEATGNGFGETDPVQGLVRSGSGDLVRSLKSDAALLPPAVAAIVSQIGGKSEGAAVSQARSELDARFRQNVVRDCTTVIQGRYPFTANAANDVPLADFGRLFGFGGVFDAFYKENLDKLVDATRHPWTWRVGVNGAAVGASAGMLREFEAAQQIRDFYFRQGQMPEVHFMVTPTELDTGATRVLVEIDGQPFDYRHGPERNWQAVWPGPNPGVAAVSFEDRSGAHPNQAFQGPWALFRLLDVGQIRATSATHFVLTYQLGGHEAQIAIEAASIRNPFGKQILQSFRCGS
jgi:type VI secretion system protein ImpL